MDLSDFNSIIRKVKMNDLYRGSSVLRELCNYVITTKLFCHFLVLGFNMLNKMAKSHKGPKKELHSPLQKGKSLD